MRHNYSLEQFKCIKCGRCCLDYGCSIGATERDILRWEREKRIDILSKVRTERGENKKRYGALWFNPKTRREYIYCPFLKRDRSLKARILRLFQSKGYKYYCSIHKSRPGVCRDYICRKHLRGRVSYALLNKSRNP